VSPPARGHRRQPRLGHRFYEFSNLSICLQFEIPIEHLPLLAESLLDAGVKFSTRSESNPVCPGPEMATGPIQCTLQFSSFTTSPIFAAKSSPSPARSLKLYYRGAPGPDSLTWIYDRHRTPRSGRIDR